VKISTANYVLKLLVVGEKNAQVQSSQMSKNAQVKSSQMAKFCPIWYITDVIK
jgi:hypothetical protein